MSNLDQKYHIVLSHDEIEFLLLAVLSWETLKNINLDESEADEYSDFSRERFEASQIARHHYDRLSSLNGGMSYDQNQQAFIDSINKIF